jgi:hypothetical protein
MTELNYARAQARWLADRFPEHHIDVELVDKVVAEHDSGYSYSSYTYADGSFKLVVHQTDGRSVHIDLRDVDIDLTAMVVEGLRMELAAAAASQDLAF